MTSVKSINSWSYIVIRWGLFALIWWILTDGDMSSWWIGLPTVTLAVTASVSLLPQTPIVWTKIPKFVHFFLIHSLLGGTDVAWRAFHPGLPISPDFIEYPLRLPPGLQQVFMTNMISLLPGTLSAELDRGVIIIHVLDNQSSFLAELELLEQNVARIFGKSLTLSGD